ncbi:pentatricopeptide repeat-containing protein At1g06270 [Syzygium oleosum]|uniref:pentatricopeptide repeat-containing protein At1g06270 n=1 Tax=Syzygium oleosum TaxID=219896 RepID=UPI0011D1FFB6|nr:pentatricopeptide repeat-containing protein At1g06270 [Syzygium oleosum]XP_056177105.1 pentatricopeptide repeat-containing protein At1g06270 [Syzygium oleosum]XP_056177106.1 pentatricopeptide repeat-containing protein At1g06270 [Syzygium oleosum]
MIAGAKKLCRSSLHFSSLVYNFSPVRSVSSLQSFEEALKAAIQTKNYQHIPDLLNSSQDQNPKLLSFLSDFPRNDRTQIIDDILQSFVPLRPRSRLRTAYSCLLCYTLQSPDPFPLALSILQRTLRSGCSPAPQARLFLSSAWLEQLSQSRSVADILLDMRLIGYSPDTGTCNFVISSLCAVDQLGEAIKVLKGMTRAGCVPDLDSYGAVIGALCSARRTPDAVEMLKQMVKVGLTPRQDTVVKMLATLRATKEIRKAVETIEFLEKENYPLRFESYERLVEGCLECHEHVLAGKAVMAMTARGFIPYIGIRQKVVEGLAACGEMDLVCAVRQRFVELRS